MKRFFIVISAFIFLFLNSCFADKLTYSEDNGAYWYQKALELMPSNYSVSYNFNTEDHHVSFRVTRNNTSFTIDNLNKIVDYLKIARSKKNCSFFVLPEYDGDEKSTLNHRNFYSIEGALSPASTMAIYALSVDKPEYASIIWLSILDISLNLMKNNSIQVRYTTGTSAVRSVLSTLSSYFEKGATEDFKKTFIEYMKAWPTSVLDLNEIKKVHYDYYMNSLEKYSNNTEILAKLFGYDKNAKKTRIVKNKICTQNIHKMVEKMQTFFVVLHLYLYGLQVYNNDYLEKFLQSTPYHYFVSNEKQISTILDEMYYHQLIKYMLGVIFIFFDDDYICPENGYRTLKVDTRLDMHDKFKVRYNFVSCYYRISCDCKGKEEPISPDPNKVALEEAKRYRKSPRFISDEKEYKEYCENLLNIDFSKELTENDMKVINKEMRHSNKLMGNMHFNEWQTLTKFNIDRIKDAQKQINEFFKKYVSD